MSSPFGRIGLAGGISHHHRELVQRAACNLATGDLYTFPNSSSTIDATKSVTFAWNAGCPLGATTVDLYLYETAKGLIRGWTNVDYASGSFTTNLLPKWWNSTTTANLQLSIMKSGAASWDTSSPPGPIFKVTYPESAMFMTTTANGIVKTATADAAVTNSADAIFQDVSAMSKPHGISKRAIAAAVVVPLLVLVAVAAVAVRFWRSKEKEKRRRWSQAMSQHSNLEWEKGALPGDKPASILGGGRPSISSQQPRASIGSFQPRPNSMATSSMYAVENNMAGTGANGAGIGFPRPSFSHNPRSQSTDNLNLRSSLVLPDGQVRQSRISFAETTRPDRRSRLSLGDGLRPTVSNNSGSASVSSGQGLAAFFKLPYASKSASALEQTAGGKKSSHATGSAIADEDETDVSVSPSQMQGPGGFAEADMRRVASNNKSRTGTAGAPARRSLLSLGSNADRRRESVASALSADDFKSAASARGSVDELRDIERSVLARRSMMTQSQYSSVNSPADFNNDRMEDLDNNDQHYPQPQPHAYSHDSPIPSPSPAAAAHQINTVVYGPDQMLAVYAARGKIAGTPDAPPALASPISTSAPSQTVPASRPTVSRLLSTLTKRGDNDAASPSENATPPTPTEMKSMVHLNNGVVSSKAVEAMPHPGPGGSA